MGIHDGKGMAALGAPCECFRALQHRLPAFRTHFVHFGSCREHTVQGFQGVVRGGKCLPGGA